MLSHYDWTGLTFAVHSVSYWGYVSDSTYTIYLGPMSWYGFVGGFMGSGLWSASQSGTSTFKWQWLPPGHLGGSPGPPDHDLFPAEPLYVLGRVMPTATAQSSGTAGLAATGTVADGWGWTDSFDTIPGAAPQPGSPPRRSIVSASTADNIATMTLSPSAFVAGTGIMVGDSATLGISQSEAPFPILLGSPNVLGRPDLGDGTNQYAYDAATPGRLHFGTDISLVWATGGGSMTASAEDTTWAAPHLDWQIEPSIAGMRPYTKETFAGSIDPRSDLGGGQYADGAFWFFGLPANNSQFGDRLVSLMVDGQASQKAHIRVFYNADAVNHPDAAFDPVPNWYHYYNQVSASPGTYRAETPSYTEPDSPYRIWVSPDAFQAYDHRVFALRPGHETIHFIGWLDTSGLLQYVGTCAHEAAHASDYQAGILLKLGSPEQMTRDLDGDCLDDSWEAQHHLDPNNSDTARAYGGAANGDSETIAEIRALSVLLANKEHWCDDWATGGLQWGAWGRRYPPYAAYYGLAQTETPYHPWNYRSFELPWLVQPDPPSDALTAVP